MNRNTNFNYTKQFRIIYYKFYNVLLIMQWFNKTRLQKRDYTKLRQNKK